MQNIASSLCVSVCVLPSSMAGQIICRGKNVWLVRIYLGRDESGKRIYLNKTIHGPRKAAQAWLNQRLTERDAGVAVKPAQQTLNEYLDRWLETAAKPKVRPKTLLGYRNLLDCHIRPALGARPLGKISPLEVQQAFQTMQEKGLSARTIEYARMILKQAFRQAIQWRLLTFNPCDGVPIPRRERREMQALSPEQARRFLAVARGTRHGALFELALTTGLRPSEYLALKWEDIDFERGTLSVVRSLDAEPGGGYRLEETKTRNSRRVVKLLPGVLSALVEHRQAQQRQREEAGERWKEQGFVFTNELGGPLERHNLAHRHLRKILEEAGLPQIRLYDLRHTAATLALSAGVPVKVVSEMLGHSSVALTLDFYSHVLPHMQEDAARRMAALLEDSGGEEASRRHTIGTQPVKIPKRNVM
jgi:integrase